MSIAQALITAEQFAEMTFDHPVELVEGEIVEMPRPDLIHGKVCFRIAYLIGRWYYAQQRVQGEIVTNDSGVVTAKDPDTVRGPDVAFIQADRLPGNRLPRGFTNVVPNVCIEVLSPSDRWRDVHHKIDEYLNCGVQEVWIVDPRQRNVQVFQSEEAPQVFAESQELTSAILPGFACGVAAFFEGV